jgi:inner membrane protein
MPSIGHVAVGLVAARLEPKPPAIGTNVWRLGLVALSALPDLDVIAFALGIPYGAPWGHRGAAHSLAVAGLCGLTCAAGARMWGAGAVRMGIVGGLVMASHGLLDTMTDGGLGIALLWPWSNHRFFAPWRTIPVAPIGAALFSVRGVEVMLTEAALFLPVFIVGLWPRKKAE